MKADRRGTRPAGIAGLLLAVVTAAFNPTPTGATGGVADRPGVTALVSRAANGGQARAVVEPGHFGKRDHLMSCRGAPSPEPGLPGADMTPDGRYVAFVTLAALVGADTNRACDVYVVDRLKSKIVLGSIAFDGAVAQRPSANWETSQWPSLSNNGRFVAFGSAAPNLVPGDTNKSYDVFVRDLKRGTTVRVSVDSNEGEANPAPGLDTSPSYNPSISGDGTRVAFVSSATDLVSGDTNFLPDTFLRDIRKGTTKRIGFYGWTPPSMSRNGRYVLFLGTRSQNAREEIDGLFRYDVAIGEAKLVVTSPVVTNQERGCTAVCVTGSHAWGGRQISDDGRYVAFWSDSSRFVPSDTNSGTCSRGFGRDSLQDIFVKDLKTGRIERVSVSSNGEEATWGGPTWLCFGALGGPSISGNGRFVSFTSFTNLSPDDTGDPWCQSPCDTSAGDADVFVHDRRTGALDWISVAPGGKESKTNDCWGFSDVGYSDPSNPPDPTRPPASVASALSGTGRYALFLSCADNLVGRDRNREWDFFVRDLGSALGVGGTTRSDARIEIAGAPGFGDRGVIRRVDAGDDLHPALTKQGANLLGASLAYRPRAADIYVRLELADMPRAIGPSSAGNGAITYGVDILVNGTRYQARVQPAAAGSAASFGLFRCRPERSCTELTGLRGGVGTTGVEVVISLPLRALGLERGGLVDEVKAFTSMGSFAIGPLKPLDVVHLR